MKAGGVSVARDGSGPPVLFVHGSVVGGATWAAQRPLSERFTTLVLDRRGFGASPPAEADDYEVDARDIAAALGDGAHLVAHSYGAIGAMLAAAMRPRAVRSLTLVEPVAYSVAIEHPAVQRSVVDLISYFQSTSAEPRPFLKGFLSLIGAPGGLPDPLPEAMQHTTRLLIGSRVPFGARIPLDELTRARIAALVVSGGHSDAFEAICDTIAGRLDAQRAVIAGARHFVPAMADQFNERLVRFLEGT